VRQLLHSIPEALLHLLVLWIQLEAGLKRVCLHDSGRVHDRGRVHRVVRMPTSRVVRMPGLCYLYAALCLLLWPGLCGSSMVWTMRLPMLLL
jgi:hypothetical protein